MFTFDKAVFVYGLTNAVQLNNRGGRVCELEPRPGDGRIGVQMLLGAQKVWVKAENLKCIHHSFDLHESFFDDMSEEEKADMRMYLFSSQNASPIPGVRGVVCNLMDTDEEYAPLTEEEKTELLRVGQWGANMGRAEFRTLVEQINLARGGLGNYPKDWHAMVIDGQLFRTAGQQTASDLQVGGPEILQSMMQAAQQAAEQSTQPGMDSDDDEFDVCVDAVFKLKYPSYSKADRIADANSIVHGEEYGEYAHNLLRDMFNAKHDASAVKKAGRVMFEKGGHRSMQGNFYNYRVVTMDMAKKAQIDERVYAEWWGGARVAMNRAWEGIGGWMA